MDVAVVGGGLVGMATARALVAEGLEVVVYEAASHLGQGQSGHNSNVIHSGAFYVPGSLKARLAVSGREMLEHYISNGGLPIGRPGKLVVQQAGENERFDELVRRAEANGVAHEVLGSASAMREIEATVTGERALWLPSVAVTDFRQVLESLADEVRVAGGVVSLGARVRIDRGRILAHDRYVSCKHTVVAAGTGFNVLCPDKRWRVLGFKGAYRQVTSPTVRRLVYAVPHPRYPFLGVHLTPGLDGRVLAGPNATMAPPYVLGRGSLLAARNWRMGLRELSTHLRTGAMRDEVRRYVPDAEIDRPVVEAGVRAQAVDTRGRWADDFVLIEDPGVTWVANAPSPAATACLSIGDHLASLVKGRLVR